MGSITQIRSMLHKYLDLVYHSQDSANKQCTVSNLKKNILHCGNISSFGGKCARNSFKQLATLSLFDIENACNKEIGF